MRKKVQEKNEEKKDIKKGEPLVFFDIQINGSKIGTIDFKLYSNIVPKTAENFRCLCTGEKGYAKKSKKKLSFKDTFFHRVIPQFMCQGGDFTNFDGKGGESIYGEKFNDENFIVKHNKKYLLSMANSGKNTNGSQFFITTTKTPHLNGKQLFLVRL